MKLVLKILIFYLFVSITNSGFWISTDFDIIKDRVISTLMISDVNEENIETLILTINKDGTWPGIDYKDVSNEGFQHSQHSGNLVKLAKAYRDKNSNFFHNDKVKETVVVALKNWVDNDYICDNWWYNQIGTPNHLVHVLLLLGDELPIGLVERTQPIIGRANIDAPGARPGGDRIKIAGIQAKNLLFLGDNETFEKVIKVIESEIKYVEWIGDRYGYTYRLNIGGFANRKSGGRGIQYDNSFHHRTDGVNNTLSYGLGYADAFVEWAVYTSGTQYSFSNKKLQQLVDYFLDGICKTAIYGKYPDPGAKNRSIARGGALRPYNTKTAENLLLTTKYRKKELQEIVDVRNNNANPTISHATFFWHSEHFTYQRPNWFTSVRMYSTRIHNMEVPYNSEGLLNHHRGDGANHISFTGEEYYDIFPVFDYQKIPGTTIMQKDELPVPSEIQKLGSTEFVGAVTEGVYGAVAFDFKSPHDPLIARKSWFFFDDEYVCLGAGISCKKQNRVVTTLNQCLLRGDVIVSIGNNEFDIERGENKYDNVDWVFHDNIGYVFPESTLIQLKIDETIGSWSRINKQNRTLKDEVSLDIFKLWVNHGKRPSDETYEYIVVPATSIDELSQKNSRNNIKIISNTPDLQAVMNKKSGICQAVFYKAGEMQITESVKFALDHPGIIMVEIIDDKIFKISVSDPNRDLKRFHLSFTGKIRNSDKNHKTVWNVKDGQTYVSIELPENNYAGDSVTVEF